MGIAGFWEKKRSQNIGGGYFGLKNSHFKEAAFHINLFTTIRRKND
jgi:hypothetical protein